MLMAHAKEAMTVAILGVFLVFPTMELIVLMIGAGPCSSRMLLVGYRGAMRRILQLLLVRALHESDATGRLV